MSAKRPPTGTRRSALHEKVHIKDIPIDIGQVHASEVASGTQVGQVFRMHPHQLEMQEAEQMGYRMKLDLNEIEYTIIENEADFERMIQDLMLISNNDKTLKFENLIANILSA